VAAWTRPYDAQDGAGKQDGAGHIAADEGDGEDGGHDVEGGRGGMDQWGEEADEGTGESREHEGGEAERPDAGAGLIVGHVSPPAARLSHTRRRAVPTGSLVRASGGGGVGEPAAQGREAQAGEGAGLGLLHGLAREPKTVANLL